MRLRTTIFLAFVAISVLQASVVPFALRYLNQRLSRTHHAWMKSAEQRVHDGLAAMEKSADDTMARLAASQEAERLLAAASRDEQASALRTAGADLMRAYGLEVLSIFDERGRTLTSGHLPARLGDPDEALWAVAQKAMPTPSRALVDIQDAQGLRRLPAVLVARRLEYGDLRLWAVGGFLFEQGLARSLASRSGARVEIWSEGSPVATEGEAPEPVVEQKITLEPVELRVVFSRAELLAAERGVLRAFAVLFGMGLLLALAAGFLVARRVTRPVEALTDVALEVARGNLQAKVKARAVGEVAELVLAFNRMTADLQHTTERLRASERVAAWQEVARRLAHEIKNPLTPIRMSLETLTAAADSNHPDFRRLFRETSGAVVEEVDRLRRIVDEFSRFARLPKPQLAPVDLGQLAEQVVGLWGGHAGIRLSAQSSLNVLVRADRDQLTQVLTNLVKNAEEALGDHGQISVRASTGLGEARLEVEDDGPGIRPEDRAHVFEPYFTTKAGGTGLGLAIAARICQEHGGRLEVEDASPRGTRFVVTLPLDGPAGAR